MHVAVFFFFNDTATTEIYTLSLHDALPISARILPVVVESGHSRFPVMDEDRDDIVGILLAKDLLRLTTASARERSEEHTSELQSPCNLVCRLLLEKQKRRMTPSTHTLDQAH